MAKSLFFFFFCISSSLWFHLGTAHDTNAFFSKNSLAKSLGEGDVSWEELLGSNHWDGLLHPLNQTLRLFLLKLGDFQTVQDAYITEEQSMKYNGSIRYGVDSLFQNTFFPFHADYSVEGFLYFSVLNGVAYHWIGYVAVSTCRHINATGRFEIYVVLRGTDGQAEICNDLHFDAVPFDPNDTDAMVMRGWKEYYTGKVKTNSWELSLQEQLQGKIKDLLKIVETQNNKNEKKLKPSIVCVGYSMGGALAILSAYDIVNSGLSKVGDEYFPVAAMTFESPRVGNSAFDDRLKNLTNLRVLRVTNANDLVPMWPPIYYVDNGEVLHVDSRRSNYLKEDKTGINYTHNLEVVLHTVSGWNDEETFDVNKGGRDWALVNKHSDILLDEYNVLPTSSWWVEKNKGMVLGDDGKWHEMEPEDKTLLKKAEDKTLLDT